MADILRGYGLAREGAYFKQEQEADIQRHRRQLVKDGKLPSDADAQPVTPRREMTLAESAKVYEVEPTILQQGARIDDPNAAAKREYECRRKAALPPLSPEEVEQHTRRVALHGDNHLGAVPRVDLRRNRYNVAALYEAGAAAQPVPSVVQEATGRAYTATLRAVGYGSLLTITSLSLLAAYTLQQQGVTDAQTLRERMQVWMAPVKASLQQRMQPIKEYVASVAPPPASGSSPARSEFAEELARVVKSIR